jgi:hypothetical protein
MSSPVPDIKLGMSPDMSTSARGVSADMSRRRSDQMSVNGVLRRVDTASGATECPAAGMSPFLGWRSRSRVAVVKGRNSGQSEAAR